MSEGDTTMETVKYLVLRASDEFVIEVPRDWKVTFGAVNPGRNGEGNYVDRSLHALRIWERMGGNKADQLRAVFCDVRSFRDLSIPLARKVAKETGSTSWTMDSEGGFDRSTKRQIESSWEDPQTEEDIPF